MNKKLLLTYWLVLSTVLAFAQLPTFEWRLENEQLTSATTYQFDVNIYNTGSTAFELRGGTIAFMIDTAWSRRGTLTVTTPSSGLVAGQQTSTASFANQTATVPAYFRKIITTVGAGVGTTIPANSVVKCFTIVLTNTVAYSTTVPPKFAWKFNEAPAAGFNYDNGGANVSVVSNIGTAAVLANQAFCYTPIYWNGTGWRTANQTTNASVTPTPAATLDAVVYAGTVADGFSCRHYNLRSGTSHNLNSGILNVSGNVLANGTLSSSAGTIRFLGNAFSRQTTNTALVANSVTINSSLGVALGGSLTINDTLSLTNGNVFLSNNNLIMGSSAKRFNGSSTSYIVTNGTGTLNMSNIGATAVTFPVGTSTAYNPATLQNLGVSDNFQVSVADTIVYLGAGLSSNAVKKTWKITETNPGTAVLILNLQWNAADELPSFNRANSYISFLNNSGLWQASSQSAATGSSPYVQTLNGVVLNSNFGSFAVASSGTLNGPPTISSFSPNSGTVGTLVTISGNNLSNSTSISIGGVNAILIGASANSITALVMPGAITGALSVTTAAGTSSATSIFTLSPSIAPNTQQGNKLVGTGSVGSANQGYSVSLSADGNTAIVGGSNDNSYQGAAWIYTRSGNTWTQQGNKLVGTGNVGSAYQGISVSLSADGNTAIVGGYGDNNGQGAAWVYTRSGNTWTQQGNKLVGTGSVGAAAQQGVSVSLSADGNTAIVGGYGDNNGQGATWVYTRTGNTWTQQGNKLVGTGNVGQSQQGFSVSLSADGNTAMVGGFADNNLQGAAWVYTRSGNRWTQQGNKLVGTGVIDVAYQGRAISLSADGNKAIVGGYYDNSSQGAAWVYTRSGNTWTQQGNKLVGTGSIGNEVYQGYSVSLSADGKTAIVGGISDNSGLGAVWIYNALPLIYTISAQTTANGTISPSGTINIAYGGSQRILFTPNTGYMIDSVIVDGIKVDSIVAYTFSNVTSNRSIRVTFTLIGPPTISSFSPNSGTVGTLVTISGNNLTNPTSISIGGVNAILISASANSITALVMPGALTGALSVTTAAGTSSANSNFTLSPSIAPNTQQGNKLVGTGSVGSSYQGASVSLSADGNTAIVGGFMDNSSQGAAWVYTRSGNTWTQQGNKLVGTGNIGNAGQGISVSLSADGNTAIVGGFNDNSGQGAAWVYTRTGNTWTQQGNKLVGTGSVGSCKQGISVSLSADGNTAIVGGYSDNSGQGAAWVYTRSGNTWTQQGNKLVGTGSVGAAAQQGISVSLSADGNTAIVGGFNDYSGQGAAWVYTRSGNTWTQQGNKLVGTGSVGSAWQGYSVSLSADGNTAMVGGYADNSLQGAAWVYTRTGNTWTQQGTKLVGTGNVGNANQGISVSLSADGNTAIVGGRRDNGNGDQGAAWVYKRNGNTWTQQGNKLVGTGNVGQSQQGCSVSLSADGNTAMVGGLYDNSDQGAAWVYNSVPPIYTISAQTNANGTINPSGIINIAYGGNQRIIFTPNTGYKVDSVIVDGIKIDSIVGYTFSNVTSNRSIRVTFTPIIFTISTQSNSNGIINPSGNISIAYGGNQRILFTPNTGYIVDSVIVDGIKVDSIVGYTFSNVTSNRSIRVVFIALPIIPYISISSIHPIGSYINTNTPNNVLASYQIIDSVANALLSSLSFTSQGTYTIADVQSMGFKCWLNSTNDLVGATQIGTSQAFVASGGAITLSGLSQNIPIGISYILVSCDISNTAENGNTIGLASMPIGNFSFSGSPVISGASILAASNLFTINGTGPVKMQYRTSNSYKENFSDIANWSNGFASGIGAGRWAGVTTSAGTIPSAKAITVSTANFQTSSSGAGIQRGSLTGNVAGTIAFLSLGNTDNTSACAVDFFMDYTKRNADSLVFDAATVFNGVGNRNSTLRVYWSIDGTNFTELSGNNLPYIATNNVANSTAIRAKLPIAFNNVATCRLRFYYHNGTGGTTGLRPKISIDNVQVSAICPVGTSTTNINSCTPYTWNGITYNASGIYNKTFSEGSVWGCDSVASLNLNMNPIVSFNPFQDTLKVCGTSYTLNAGSGFVSYIWSTGATSSTISPSNANWYKVTVSNGFCLLSDSVLLSLVNANITNRDTTICLGKSITLNVAGSGVISSPLSYLWSNSSINQNITVSPALTTTYYCTVSNGINSCKDSVKVTRDNFNPNLFVQDTLKVCGTSYTLNVDSGYASYLWNTGSSARSLNTTTAGWKNCAVSNGLCSSKDSVLLSMIHANIINNDSTIVAGTPITLRATGTGIISTPLTYLWSSGANTQNITVSPTQKTTYYCTVSNGISSCADTVKIWVNLKINLKMYFEAFYENGSLKSSLYNADGSSDIGLFDTVQIMLYDSMSNAIVYSIKSIADTGGVCQILIPSAYAGSRYYIGIKHRGSIETWTNSSVLLNNGLVYNFTSSASKAYGANLKDDGNGIYLIYNGDVNQDGSVDFNDYPDLDISSNNGDLGYYPTDLNGDGSVDFGDYPTLDINSNDGIIALTPIVYNGFIRNKSIKKSLIGK
jgi:hypothetical protein